MNVDSGWWLVVGGWLAERQCGVGAAVRMYVACIYVSICICVCMHISNARNMHLLYLSFV